MLIVFPVIFPSTCLTCYHLWSFPHLHSLFLESHPILHFSLRNLSNWETWKEPWRSSNPLSLQIGKQSPGGYSVHFTRKAGLNPFKSSVLFALYYFRFHFDLLFLPNYLLFNCWHSWAGNMLYGYFSCWSCFLNSSREELHHLMPQLFALSFFYSVIFVIWQQVIFWGSYNICSCKWK